MSKYCCLTCPAKDYSEKQLDDKCPSCGNTYGFQLKEYPNKIGDYTVIKPLSSRGFYSVTYIAEIGKLSSKYVLKVSSKVIYEFFGKNFEDECRKHKAAAEDSEHVVDIIDFFEEDITFGDVKIPCNVAVLEYVNGDSFQRYLENDEPINANTIAQIGIDLFRIIGDLQSKQINHNDLHSGNIIIQKLREGSYRAEALDQSIRAKVIDLGSLSNESISNEDRLGDINWVSKHLSSLSRILLKEPEKCEDIDFRLASLLSERAALLSQPVLSLRLPNIEECIKDIKQTFQIGRSPWQEPPKLSRFDDAYNAQTLSPWFVPLLLVDPDKQWQSAVSTKGPQLIVGMRGCGKTMLLRSLQFHARASKENGESNDEIIQRLKSDGYLGLYVSCMRILETHGTSEINKPYARLLIGYALEANRAVRHLQEINRSDIEISNAYYRHLAEALAESLSFPEINKVSSELELERKLIQLQISLSTGEKTFELKGHPVEAFSRLALAIKKCSTLWSGQYVLFLLDDVSTRYLDEEPIRKLLSQLIFQHEECAFKFTTEAQTLQLVLRSPGEIERAREGRDYRVFDLGAAVYEKVHSRGKQGKKFVESILNNRAKYYQRHPNAMPGQILGDTSLESIAESIVIPNGSREKKEAYWGISALAGVCVGDIGDVISIYELMLRKAIERQVPLPIPSSIQSESYQNFCSRRLYDLHRKGGYLKNFALSFAEASHYLLVQSNVTRKTGKRKDLRQYNRIYVRITTGDLDEQFKKLRELIDHGVFVLAGGSDTPRTKPNDSNPIQQFALTYRKLFGLSNYIGLAERDRFELEGEQLVEWLDKPENGKEILLRNLAKDLEGTEDVTNDAEETNVDPQETQVLQPNLFETRVVENVFRDRQFDEINKINFSFNIPFSTSLTIEQIAALEIDEIVVGLGFEDRSLESVRRILERVNPTSAHLLYYPGVKGYGDEIKSLIDKKIEQVNSTSYTDLLNDGLELNGKNILIDVSGLAKPFIFQSVRNALKLNKNVYICNTQAQLYYPRDEQIEEVFEAEKNSDSYKLIENLSRLLVSGEEGRYDCEAQLDSDSDDSRRRSLCAFSSVKHERLLTLLDEREYDYIEIVTPDDDSPKSRIAKLVAEVVASNYSNSGISSFSSHDLPSILDFLVNRYNHLYVLNGYNFELALTGSKLQAVACAALSDAVKVSQCWYVRPQSYDINKFTIGVGQSKFYEVSIKQNSH
jgi:serine/threonine protein kinase